MRLPLTMRLLLALVLLLVLAPPARAGWQPPQPLDGPNADVVGLGGVDVARDGTGGIAYLRRDGVYVVRLNGGAWGAPERVGGPATEAAVAAGDGGRLVVAWIAGGSVFAAVADGGAFGPVATLGGPGAASLALDAGITGTAYAVWAQAGDVRSARLVATAWSPVAGPLDVAPAQDAGQPRVAVSAEGYALAAWREAGADGRTHVYARRLLGTALSAFPRDLTLEGGNADSPDVTTQWDSGFAWVAFRQDVGGVSHTYARHFLGSTFDPPVSLDGGAPSDSPRVSIDGGGDGAAVVSSAGRALSSVLDRDVFGGPVVLGAGLRPLVSGTDEGNVAAAWLDPSGQAHGRFLAPGTPFEPDTPLSRPELGGVNDLSLSGDRVGDYAVAMVQGPDGARTLSAAVWDRPPGRPAVPSGATAMRRARPSVRWAAGLDLWGAQTFRVYFDNVLSGQTTAETFVPPKPLASGRHTYRIDAVDRVGQVTASHTRTLRIDALAPRLSVAVRGARRAGHALRIVVKARDRGGSGVDHVKVDYGDRRGTTRARTSFHAYRRGRFTLKVTAVDRAGNVARRSVKLRIR
jgi:hypothetical protein